MLNIKRKLAFFTFTLLSANALAANIQLEVSNIETLEGDVMVVLFNSAETYSSGEPLAAKKLEANANTISTIFEGLEQGEYAIKLYHDENSNGELDTNFMGLPSEGYGFSNNAGRFGPAPYEDAKFNVEQDTKVEIKLR